MIVVRWGCSRTVLLVAGWAVKVPTLRRGWRPFLHGLLANLQERQFSRTGWPELCPVLWSLPGGWLVVMRRAEPLARELTEGEYLALTEHDDYVVPAEDKIDSWGVLDGRFVAVDYGN